MNPSPSIPSFSNRKQKASSGFTLVEILVAISIFAILLTSIYGIFSSISATKDRLDGDSEAYHRARVIFDRLGREVHGAYFSEKNSSSQFRGGLTDDDEPFLELSTTAVSPLSDQGTGFALVRYSVESDPENDTGGKVLLRSEVPLLTLHETSSEPAKMRLAAGIASFQVRFYAEGSWHEEWDAATSGLPTLVEISLAVMEKDGRSTPFLSAFELPMLSSLVSTSTQGE